MVPLTSATGFPAPATWEVNLDLPFITNAFKPANFYQQPPRLNYNARLHFPLLSLPFNPFLLFESASSELPTNCCTMI